MTNPDWENELAVFCTMCGGNLEFDECDCQADEVDYDDMTDGYDE